MGGKHAGNEYRSDDETQSYIRYKTFEEWKDGFLIPMLDKILFCMKKGGKCLLNVGNVIYAIDTAVEKHLDSIGVKHQRMQDFKIGGGSSGIAARTGEDGEPFILFQKE